MRVAWLILTLGAACSGGGAGATCARDSDCISGVCSGVNTCVGPTADAAAVIPDVAIDADHAIGKLPVDAMPDGPADADAGSDGGAATPGDGGVDAP